MPAETPMQRLYARLKAFGFDAPYVREFAFPPHWQDKMANTNPAVYAQALSLLAQRFNLDIRTLLDENARLQWKDCPETLYLRNSNVTEEQLDVVRCLAARLAEVALSAAPSPQFPLPQSARDVRERIPAPVGFADLLDYCWDAGIPVLPVSHFPIGAKKPKALVAMFSGRPVIVICGAHTYEAWMLFWLAHELGHILKGHLKDTSLLVDEKLSHRGIFDGKVTPDFLASLSEAERVSLYEAEATAEGLEILTGKPNVSFRAPFLMSGRNLALDAIEVGQREKIDPGVIALNYAWNEGRFDIGNGALVFLPQKQLPVELIYRKMCERLDWEELTRDEKQYLKRMTAQDGK